MRRDTRRTFFGRTAALTVFSSVVPKLFAQQTAPGTPAATVPQSTPTGDAPRRGSRHTHNGVYYFSGTGANDGYPKKDEGNKDPNVLAGIMGSTAAPHDQRFLVQRISFTGANRTPLLQ